MRLYRDLMHSYRLNPSKFREIIDTARYVDLDRNQLMGHLCYLGDDNSRVLEYWGPKAVSLIITSVATGIIGAYMDNLGFMGLGFLGLFGGGGLLLPAIEGFGPWLNSWGRPYAELRREALENIKQLKINRASRES